MAPLHDLACPRIAARFLAGLLFAMLALPASASEVLLDPEYVGTETCIACHEDEGAAWSGSHHALAWTPPTADHIVADFDGTIFEGEGMVARFRVEADGTHAVAVTEQDGVTTDYTVHSVAGIAPLQQYLLETEEGRLQSFDVVWDVDREEWYHLYPGSDLPPDDGLHWTGPYKNWNTRCAECHATGFEKNYDAEARSYASEQAEISVGCEACHGAGSVHLALVNDEPVTGNIGHLDPYGFSMAFSDTEATIQQCAGCHSRRQAHGQGNPVPGTPYHDAYDVALLRPGLYHADGQILDEVYVYGSFLQSKMYARGVGCLDCHDAHTAERVAEGKAICTQCHSPAGNPDFPTLTLAEYDSRAHHFHDPEGEGGQCRNCHMIERDYMGIDGRRDHSFRVPRPDTASVTGAPDACTDCHDDQTQAWAAAQLEAWYPDSRHRGPHFGLTLARGRQEAAAASGELAALASDTAQPGIVRATALWLLETASDAGAAGDLAGLLQDPDPVVRSAAVGLQRAVPPDARAAQLEGALRDPSKSVRIAAARALLDVPPGAVRGSAAEALRVAMGEWQASIRNRLDFPETHLQLGGFALTRRNIPAAVAAFREAVALDPQRVDAWAILVRIAAATQGPAQARAVLNEALAINPDDPELLAYDAELP